MAINKHSLICIGLALVLLSPLKSKARIAKKRIEPSFVLGLSTPILDNGLGFHVGYNPNYQLSYRLSLEGQASHTYNRINGSFLSGDRGHEHTTSLFLGGRYYFRKYEKRLKPFISIMAGPQYLGQRINNLDPSTKISFGGTIGGFIEYQPWAFGLSYETPGQYIFKVVRYIN